MDLAALMNARVPKPKKRPASCGTDAGPKKRPAAALKRPAASCAVPSEPLPNTPASSPAFSDVEDEDLHPLTQPQIDMFLQQATVYHIASSPTPRTTRLPPFPMPRTSEDMGFLFRNSCSCGCKQ